VPAIDFKGAATPAEMAAAYTEAIGELTEALRIVNRYSLDCSAHIAEAIGQLATMQAEQFLGRDATGNRLHRM
jgi:uncharacterized protein (DUF697 family)